MLVYSVAGSVICTLIATTFNVGMWIALYTIPDAPRPTSRTFSKWSWRCRHAESGDEMPASETATDLVVNMPWFGEYALPALCRPASETHHPNQHSCLS